MVLAFPFGLALCLFFITFCWTLRIEEPPGHYPPDNAILYTTHLHLYLFLLNPLIRKNEPLESIWLGYHGFLAYIFVYWNRLVGTTNFLFDAKKERSPREQIREFLKGRPTTRFGLATDSGGPYGKIRPSLLKLALNSNRPLVAIKMRAKHGYRIFRHEFPWPFSVLTTQISEPINPDQLKQIPEREALTLLQAKFDE